MKRGYLALAVLVILAVAVVGARAVTVYDIQAYPNVLTSYTYFTATTVPSQYALDEIEIKVYNLASQLVATLTEEDVYRITGMAGVSPTGSIRTPQATRITILTGGRVRTVHLVHLEVRESLERAQVASGLDVTRHQGCSLDSEDDARRSRRTAAHSAVPAERDTRLARPIRENMSGWC